MASHSAGRRSLDVAFKQEMMASGIEMDGFAEQLRRQLAEIDTALGMASSSSNVVELDQTRTGRLSRMDAMQQQALGTGMLDRLRVQRRRVVAALDRIREDTFGSCCQCHEPSRWIDCARIRPRPSARSARKRSTSVARAADAAAPAARSM